MTDSFIFSFNNFSEQIKEYPFYVGFNCGIVIDFRMKEDSEGNKDILDTYVVTSGLPFTGPHEVVGFLRELADELEEVAIEDDQLD